VRQNDRGRLRAAHLGRGAARVDQLGGLFGLVIFAIGRRYRVRQCIGDSTCFVPYVLIWSAAPWASPAWYRSGYG
jgi:hypothetical protein